MNWSTAEEMFVKAAEASLVYCEKGLVQAQRDFNRRAQKAYFLLIFKEK